MSTQHHAWTGGLLIERSLDTPLARQLYREQLFDYRAYWHQLPDAGTKRIFKLRARADAYETRTHQ